MHRGNLNQVTTCTTIMEGIQHHEESAGTEFVTEKETEETIYLNVKKKTKYSLDMFGVRRISKIL